MPQIQSACQLLLSTINNIFVEIKRIYYMQSILLSLIRLTKPGRIMVPVKISTTRSHFPTYEDFRWPCDSVLQYPMPNSCLHSYTAFYVHSVQRKALLYYLTNSKASRQKLEEWKESNFPHRSTSFSITELSVHSEEISSLFCRRNFLIFALVLNHFGTLSVFMNNTQQGLATVSSLSNRLYIWLNSWFLTIS